MNKNVFKEEIALFFQSKLSLLKSIDYETVKVNDENSYCVGNGVLDDPSDPVNLVFSIPLNHRHFFFTITEASSDVFKEELALLQHYSESASNLCVDHSIPSDSQVLNERGYAGYVLVNPDTFHKILNESIVIEDSSIKGIGVIPATQSELELKRVKGTNVLYEHWDSIGKDCVTF